MLPLVIADAREGRVMDRYQGNLRHVVAVVVGEAPEEVGPGPVTMVMAYGTTYRSTVGSPGLMGDYLD